MNDLKNPFFAPIVREKSIAELIEEMEVKRDLQRQAILQQHQQQMSIWQQLMSQPDPNEAINTIFERWGLPKISGGGGFFPNPSKVMVENIEAMSKKMEELQHIAVNKLITE